jgi:hypothetical protein
VKLNSVIDQLFANGEIRNDGFRTFIDRLLMRVWNSPSLIQYLDKVGYSEKEDTLVAQLVFNKLPDEVIQDVTRLIAVPRVRVSKFRVDGKAFVGFEAFLDQEMFQAGEPDAQLKRQF